MAKIIDSFYYNKQCGYHTIQIYFYKTDRGYCYREYLDNDIATKRVKQSTYDRWKRYMERGDKNAELFSYIKAD